MNEAELQVKVKSKGETHALRVGTPPGASAQLFASFTTAICAAHSLGAKARFDVQREPKGALKIVGVRF